MRTIARVIVAISILTTAAAAQQKPNFSGKWAVVSPTDRAGQLVVVTQDEKTLTSDEGSGHKMTYQLDGVERRLAIPGRGSEITMLARASWDGDHVVIATSIAYPNGMKTQSKEVWSIDAQGRLVIDYSETGPTGQAGPSVKAIHVKKQ